MNRNYATTMYVDNQLFEADNRERLENPDFWPPLKAAWPSGRAVTIDDPVTGIPEILVPSERGTTIAACADIINKSASLLVQRKVVRQLLGIVQDHKYQEMVDGIATVDRIERVRPETGRFDSDGNPIYGDTIVKVFTEHEEIRDYGEGFLGDGAYQADMSGLQRQIAEDCYNGSGRVQRPSQNIPQKPKHHRAEWVAQRLNEYDLADADVLITAWKTIEATPTMITQFIGWINADPTQDWVEYFTGLAAELDDAVAPVDPVIPEPTDIDYVSWLEYFGDVAYEAYKAEQGPVSTGYADDLARRWETDPDDPKLADQIISHDERDQLDSVNELAYVTINTDPGEDRWMDRQPEWVPRSIEALKKTDDLQRLGKIAQFAFKDKRMQEAHPGVRKAFWGYYRARKWRLASEIKHRPMPKLVLKRLQQADGPSLKIAARWLYELGKGYVKAKGWRPRAEELSVLWDAYRRRKAELAQNT